MKVAKNSQANEWTNGFKKEIFIVHKNLTKKTQRIHKYLRAIQVPKEIDRPSDTVSCKSRKSVVIKIFT